MPIAEDHIVIDVEIQKTIEETPGGWDATDKLGISVAVIYEFRSDRFRIYGPDDSEAIRSRLEVADRISGYNIWKFDFPVIYGLPGRERVWKLASKTNDLLVRIWASLGLSLDEFTDMHKGWGLNAVATSTLGYGKSGYGGDAPKWFQAGQWARVTDYCLDDVRIERNLAVWMDDHDYVVNGDRVLKLLAHPTLGTAPCLYPVGLTTCGYGLDEPMHEGSSSPIIPPNGRHKYLPALKEPVAL